MNRRISQVDPLWADDALLGQRYLVWVSHGVRNDERAPHRPDLTVRRHLSERTAYNGLEDTFSVTPVRCRD
jgi:hypothetical protein